jgi:hypothetical protein
MAEAALITPLFIFLLFGTLEFGGLFRDYLTINDATASGARGASIAGDDPNADYQILQGIKRSTNALTRSGIKKIIVYKAVDSTSTVPDSCKAVSPSPPAGVSGSCNVYNGASLSLAESPHFVDCGTDSYQANWCPTSRKNAAKENTADPTLNDGPPDFVGVFLEFDHRWFTGMFGEEFTITSTTVTRLEPKSLL